MSPDALRSLGMGSIPSAGSIDYPGQLWSLLDMLRFYAASFGIVMSNIARTNAMIRAFEGVEGDLEYLRKEIEALLEETSAHVMTLPLPLMLIHQFERLEKSVQTAPIGELAILLRELHNNVTSELSSRYFLMLSVNERVLYEQQDPPFGEKVQGKFPEAALDIAAASRCHALGEWTACVFHLMRVLEHGLRLIADEVGVNAAQENWKNVIDQIESKIRAFEQLPKTPEKETRLRFLSGAAAQFRYFKDAWRNHVSHANKNYDEHSASPVWVHVESFMIALTHEK